MSWMYFVTLHTYMVKVSFILLATNVENVFMRRKKKKTRKEKDNKDHKMDGFNYMFDDYVSGGSAAAQGN